MFIRGFCQILPKEARKSCAHFCINCYSVKCHWICCGESRNAKHLWFYLAKLRKNDSWATLLLDFICSLLLEIYVNKHWFRNLFRIIFAFETFFIEIRFKNQHLCVPLISKQIQTKISELIESITKIRNNQC